MRRADARRTRSRGAANTRSLAKDRHGLGEGQRDGWGKRDLHHDDYRLSSRAKCLRAAAKGREVERKREGEGESCYDTPAGDRRFTLAGERWPAGEEGARGMKVGMFVVRVIWPIKPRGGARRAPASRRSRIDDRRGESASRPRGDDDGGCEGRARTKEMGSGARRA